MKHACKHCVVTKRTYLQNNKTYTLPKQEDLEQYKSRINIIPDELDILIYWYNKSDKNSNNNKIIYLGSDAQLDQLCKNFSNPDYTLPDLYILDVIWKCGDYTEKISQPFTRYNQGAGYGYNNLFTTQILNENKRRVKVSVKFYKKENLQNSKNKQMKQLKLTDCWKIQCKNHQKLLLNHIISHNKYNAVEYFSHARLPSTQLDDILQKFAYKLCEPNLFNLCPTIDCFATSSNYQKICKEYITKDMDFFSNDYDDLDYWSKHIAWLFPPLSNKKISLCIKKLKSRKMKGFLCIPFKPHSFRFYLKLKIQCEEYVEMKGRDKDNDIFIADNNQKIKRCAFDIIVYYFNFQKCAVCPSHHI